MKRSLWIGIIFVGITTLAFAQTKQPLKLPKLRENAVLTFAPEVPPPITRKEAALVVIDLHSETNLDNSNFWNIPSDELFEHLQSKPDGLSSEEAKERLWHYGDNLLKPQKQN